LRLEDIILSGGGEIGNNAVGLMPVELAFDVCGGIAEIIGVQTPIGRWP
jgi:hypothetical protein